MPIIAAWIIDKRRLSVVFVNILKAPSIYCIGGKCSILAWSYWVISHYWGGEGWRGGGGTQSVVLKDWELPQFHQIKIQEV